MSGPDEEFEYLAVADILTIHEVIVETNAETEPGVSAAGDVEYAVEYVCEGHFDQKPETLHEKAFQLMRLLVANHPFVDGNKRTALASAVSFYALNGYDLDYGPEIKDILKRLATDETAVAESDVLKYLRETTTELPDEYDATYQLWLDRIGSGLSKSENSEQNDYERSEPTENNNGN
ncbi:type II toxin-antitoxin system death-on-curing family toxin [Halomicrococcus sp. NG-SE-24]|uniref:type II toxin-antitoxin system death-on-curing family toxin n=1 Tax=Halomicrococcus sp. NG-SE-24 TaxID=3436928 RepID=UPI003D99B7E8